MHVRVQKQDSAKPIRGEVSFPKQVNNQADDSIILVFAKGAQAEEAKSLGAQIVGGEELIQEISAGNLVFHKVLSTKEMFPQVVKIAKYLGPKGLMPSPARGTVSDDIISMMASLKASTIFETDEDGFIHIDFAKTGWKDEEIRGNINAFLKALESVKPAKSTLKKFVERIGVSASFTPGIIFPRKDLLQFLEDQ